MVSTQALDKIVILITIWMYNSTWKHYLNKVEPNPFIVVLLSGISNPTGHLLIKQPLINAFFLKKSSVKFFLSYYFFPLQKI